MDGDAEPRPCPRAASHGAVRVRSMVIPVEPKAWAFGVPCAQSFQQPLQRFASMTAYPPAGAPAPQAFMTPRWVPPPGQVVVVRELSPHRHPMATQPMLSPAPSLTIPVNGGDGQVSPLMGHPRSLSPPVARQARTPLVPGQQVISPRQPTPNRHVSFRPQPRAASPVGLPPVPVFAAPERCPSPRPVVIKTTPRARPTLMVTPRAVPVTTVDKAKAKPRPRVPLPKSAVKRSLSGAKVAPPKEPSSAGQLPTTPEREPRFATFTAVLSEPGVLDALCQQLLARLPGSCVRWEELVNLNPSETLLDLGLGILSSPKSSRKAPKTTEDQGCQGWWKALLARHGLYGPGDAMGAAELIELLGCALRCLRDRHAPAGFVRNLRTVHCGAKRLKELYGSFEFYSRGLQGKSYRCRSRLTREEHLCRQVCKDKVPAPADVIRAEVELLRSLEHVSIPQVIATFEDFNNIYIVLEPVESVELVNVLQQWHQTGQGLTVGWLAEIARQLLQALRHCHEQRPKSLVHGDLHLTSLLLSAQTDAKSAPQLVLADLGLAGLPPAPPAVGQTAEEDWSKCPSPGLDIWSCGCLIFMLLSGRHPFNGDPGGRLVPSASTVEPDWRMLPSAASASLCAQMLSSDLKSRPSAAECLRHSWLSMDAHDVLPMEALGNLLKSHHKSKLQEITAGLAISEQISSPFSAVGAAMSLKRAFEGARSSTEPSVKEAETALGGLGMSEKAMEKVLKAFVDEDGGKVNCNLLISHCSELAEDLLDHALWRVFTAAGEDHRGVLGVAELEKALAESSGADVAGGEPGPFGADLKPGDVVRQIARGQEVTFEELKAAIVQRQR